MDYRISGPTRVIIYARVTDLPGDPLARFQTVGALFCDHVLRRPLQPRLQVSGYDHMHIPPGFDSEKPVSRWFVYDLNVTSVLSKEELLKIPHMVFLASRQSDDTWKFISRETWTQKAIQLVSLYFWGGRAEQGEVAKMRESDGTRDGCILYPPYEHPS